MYTRLFFGTIQQGKADEASAHLSDFAQRIKQQYGCVLNQVLQNGNEIVGVSTWATKKTWLRMLVASSPKISSPGLPRCSWADRPRTSYEVKLNLYDAAGLKVV